MTTRHYFVLFPGEAYAGSFYGRTEREARTAARRWLGVDRLPRGTVVWEGAPL